MTVALAPRACAPRACRRPGGLSLPGVTLAASPGVFRLTGRAAHLTEAVSVSPILFPRFVYLGRYQQGQEVPLVLQCQTQAGLPDDPAAAPAATVYRDGSPPARIETVTLAADLRGVVDGLFRLPLSLDHRYGTAGRYLVVFRWVDGNGYAHQIPGSFTVLPGGSADGSVVALRYVRRPDARYLIWQTDTGRLVRGRNPR